MINVDLNIDSEYRTFDNGYELLFDKFVNGQATLEDLKNYTPILTKDMRMWTSPISIQLSEGIDNENKHFYLHPDTHIPEKYWKYDTFKAPFAPLDYLNKYKGWGWQHAEEGEDRKKGRTITITIWWFFSLVDLRFLFANDEDYKNYLLPYIQYKRRASTYMDKKIPLPYKIRIPEASNNKWHYVNLQLRDISAMQGKEGLDGYAKNVGLKLESKSCYDGRKHIMDVNYMEDAYLFEDYSLGDLPIQQIATKTNDFYNQIADLIGVDRNDNWGFSTGKIVSRLVSEYIVKQVKVQSNSKYGLTEIGTKDIFDKDKLVSPGLYRLNSGASPNNLFTESKLLKRKELVYLGMVDGGRAIKERPHINNYPFDNLGTKIDCLLVDIDIDGCYGNGLLNQDFAIGNPAKELKPMKFKDWERKYKNELVPGLWEARISWKNAPFKQDIILSKTDEAFTNWDYAVKGYKPSKDFDEEFPEFCNEFFEDENVYDASLYLATNSINQGCLNHDKLQLLMSSLSNSDKKWLRENAVIESFAGYLKTHEVEYITDKMLDGVIQSHNKSKKANITQECTEWVRVPLRPLLEILLKERKKHPKKTPMNVFLKLVINCIYGCIASTFFCDNGTGISNYVIGNNITSRAQVLAWCMAKGFHSIIIVTDGGFFDINKVLEYLVKSINVLEQVSQDNFTQGCNRKQIVKQIPLLDKVIKPDELIDWCLENDNSLYEYYENHNDKNKYSDIKSFYLDSKQGETLLKPVNKLAWQFLKNMFPELDIFKYNQFSFACKNWYTSAEVHSKVDYRLVNELNGNVTIALRGKRTKTQEQKQLANELFDAIKQNKAIKISEFTEGLLGFNDWRENENINNLPHDTIVEFKEFYSHTPLGARYIDKSHFKRVQRRYEVAKKCGCPRAVKSVDLSDK